MVVTGGAVAVLEELVSTAREATPPAVAPTSRAITRATSIPMREPDLVQELRRGAGLPGAAPYGVDGGTGGGDIGGPACWACHTGGVAGWGCHTEALVGGAGAEPGERAAPAAREGRRRGAGGAGHCGWVGHSDAGDAGWLLSWSKGDGMQTHPLHVTARSG